MGTQRTLAVCALLFLCMTIGGCFLSNMPPEAVISVEKIDSAEFRFSALESHDPDGAITNITWEFGDGSSGAGAVLTHTYAAPGDYNVTVYVQDDDGLTSQAEVSVTAGRELHVPRDFASIQEAIDASSDGDTISLAEGIFTEYVRFEGKAITLRGASQTGTTLQRPAIDSGNEPTSIVTFDNGESRDTILENLTIQGDAWRFSDGGAIRIMAASPTIRGCILSSNGALFGGAVYAWESNALFDGNRFLNNHATIEGGAAFIAGTDVFPNFVDNEFAGNTAQAGGALCLRAINGISTSPGSESTLRGNIFEGNRAVSVRSESALAGGAIHVGLGVRVILDDNVFDANLPGDVVYESPGH